MTAIRYPQQHSSEKRLYSFSGKFCLLYGIFLIISGGLFSQPAHFSKTSSAGIGTGVYVYQGDLTPVVTGSWKTIKPGFDVFYRKRLTDRVAISVNALYAQLEGNDLEYAGLQSYRNQRQFSFTSDIIEAGAHLQWFLRRQQQDRVVFSPYITGGFAMLFNNISKDLSQLNNVAFPGENLPGRISRDDRRNTGAMVVVPLGLGIQAPLGVNGKYIRFHWMTRVTFSDYIDGVSIAANTNRNDWYHSFNIGMGFPLRKRAKTDDEKPRPEKDVVTVPDGVKDTDGDGIADVWDACPKVPGTAYYRGCPPVDSDGDGMDDDKDKCPTLYGIAKYGGCPIPDRDGDGVNDEVDECPDEPGVIQYNGCKADKNANRNTGETEVRKDTVLVGYFDSESDRLNKDLYDKLDVVINLLRKDPALSVTFRGHADARGTIERNILLSSKRSKVCQLYLLSKNIDVSRIKVEAAGISSPAVISADPMLYWMNRRVEIILRSTDQK